MTHEQIRGIVLAAIRRIAPEVDAKSIRPDQPLREQIELDSMDWLNVLAAVDAQLPAALGEAAPGPKATLDSIVAALAARLHSAPAEPRAGTDLPRARYVIEGTEVQVRPMRADDLPLEADFVRHLSTDARYKRFMVTVKELSPQKLHDLTDVDQVRHVALTATVERDGRSVQVGVVRYIVDPSGERCEFAIAVDDAWQRTGLAGILMRTLIELARARGLAMMEGFVLATNQRMLKFARQLGFSRQRDADDPDSVRVVLRL